MDSPRFDGFARTVAARLTRRTGVALIAGAGLPLLGLVSSSDAKKNKKVTLCLNGQTVRKPKKKAKKLLKKGATKGACVPLRCGNGGPCTVFLAAAGSGLNGAQVGGLAGGDAKCQAAADASTANLTGTYKAWLSAGSETPGTRFKNIANAGPYRLVPSAGDGGNPPPTVAESFAALLNCDGGVCLNVAINRDENGQVLGDNLRAWTGTLANGNASTDTCSNWTSTATFGAFGTPASTTTTWTDNAGGGACNIPISIYCFEQAT
ncbi:MAG: hypothetical protein KC432_03245 [Thermomicrobiales bacterium]|nr:hypothetical protein [Thermomicrobiales bacterium]